MNFAADRLDMWWPESGPCRGRCAGRSSSGGRPDGGERRGLPAACRGRRVPRRRASRRCAGTRRRDVRRRTPPVRTSTASRRTRRRRGTSPPDGAAGGYDEVLIAVGHGHLPRPRLARALGARRPPRAGRVPGRRDGSPATGSRRARRWRAGLRAHVHRCRAGPDRGPRRLVRADSTIRTGCATCPATDDVRVVAALLPHRAARCSRSRSPRARRGHARARGHRRGGPRPQLLRLRSRPAADLRRDVVRDPERRGGRRPAGCASSGHGRAIWLDRPRAPVRSARPMRSSARSTSAPG